MGADGVSSQATGGQAASGCAGGERAAETLAGGGRAAAAACAGGRVGDGNTDWGLGSSGTSWGPAATVRAGPVIDAQRRKIRCSLTGRWDP